MIVMHSRCTSGSGNNRDNGIRETYNIPLWSPMGVRDANICFVLETRHKMSAKGSTSSDGRDKVT